MANELQFPKTDGDILFASEINSFTNSVRSYISGNNYYISSNNDTIFGLDNTFQELYSTDIAESKTNLTHGGSQKLDYSSITPGYFELQTNDYYIEDNCTKCYTFMDYSFFKVANDSQVESLAQVFSGGGTASASHKICNFDSTFFYIKYNMTRNNQYAHTCSFILDDGTSTVTLFLKTANGPNSFLGSGILKMYNDIANKQAIIYSLHNSVESTEIIDYSSLSGTIELKTFAYVGASGSASSRTTCYFVRAYKQNPTSSSVVSVSSDGGLTWEEVYNGTMVNVTAGNQFKAKLSGTLAADEGISIKRVILKPEV